VITLPCLSTLTDNTTATEVTSSGSPFDSYILFSFGYLVSHIQISKCFKLRKIDLCCNGPAALGHESRTEHQVSNGLRSNLVLRSRSLDISFRAPRTRPVSSASRKQSEHSRGIRVGKFCFREHPCQDI